MRAEAHHARGLDPRARVAAVDAPRDVRVTASPIELGVPSELAAADAAGRALGLCLAAPGLPVALAYPSAMKPAPCS